MKPIEDLDPEIQKIANKAQLLRDQNSGRIGRLEQRGISVDITIARLEFTLDKMAEAGILTDEQVWAWCLDWEESLSEQIACIEQKVREAAAEQMKALRKAKLAGPTAGGLLLPDGSRTKPKNE